MFCFPEIRKIKTHSAQSLRRHLISRKNIQGFLRKFYDTGKDMEEVAKAFSPDEQKAVAEVAKAFKKGVKAIDKPAAAKDADEFMTQHAQLLAYINDFQDIRAGKKKEVAASAAGVPDEL